MPTQINNSATAGKQDPISWWRTEFGEEEIERVAGAIRAEHISMGPVTGEFEERLAKALDVPYVVATTSGSMAILMALMAVGIGPEDEVIIPNRTWIATAHAVKMLGAKVVCVDVRADLPVMEASNIREKITPRTRAIIPVPLNGRAVDMEQVWDIAREFNLLVIEDAAQGLFSEYKGRYMGTRSDAGCFSLSVAKLIPTGQGGFVVTQNENTYNRLKRIRMHGVDDVINCTFYEMGFNFRFTDVLASLGLGQLERVPGRLQYLKEVYSRYEEGLKDLRFLRLIPVDTKNGEVPIYIEILSEEREKLVHFLAARNIQTRPFYPDLDTAAHLGIRGQFPNSRKYGTQGLVLPCGPSQPLANIERVLDVLKIYGEHYHATRNYCAK